MQPQGVNKLLTFLVGKQWMGLDIDQVLEVLVQQPCTVMPLASPSILGLINLRGRVVTKLDVRTVVGLPSSTNGKPHRVLIIEADSGEAVGLVVDAVGEVRAVNSEHIEQTPKSLSSIWKQISKGIIQEENRALLLMNIEKFLALTIEQQDNGAEEMGSKTRVLH